MQLGLHIAYGSFWLLSDRVEDLWQRSLTHKTIHCPPGSLGRVFAELWDRWKAGVCDYSLEDKPSLHSWAHSVLFRILQILWGPVTKDGKLRGEQLGTSKREENEGLWA